MSEYSAFGPISIEIRLKLKLVRLNSAAERLQHADAVVLADCGCSVGTECIEDADGKCLADELADVGFVGPAEGGYLVVGS
jgi:hypothetical protein